ncbi:MAG: hypothetical protein OXK16_00790 [bacterium]|nr:hypothetical protein [bacterium]
MRDLETAIADWHDILEVLSPEHTLQLTRGEGTAHGVLIELATRCQAVGDRWYPHPGNAENAHLATELHRRWDEAPFGQD